MIYSISYHRKGDSGFLLTESITKNYSYYSYFFQIQKKYISFSYKRNYIVSNLTKKQNTT